MKNDKKDTHRTLESFEKEIKVYKEQLQMNVIKLEAKIETIGNSHRTMIEKQQDQL